MRAVLPGQPRAEVQAVCTASWNGKQLIAYITGNAFVVLTGPNSILQTIYDDCDESLQALTIDEASGKIATCAGTNIRVYKPYGQEQGALKWSLQQTFVVEEDTQELAATLSWGVAQELLVGSSELRLFTTLDDPTIIWRRRLANTAKSAKLSYDSAYIASTGKYDRLVKIWRRLSFGADDTRFDFSYLPHPATVTNIYWRKPYHVEQTIDNVLYTVCADNVLRIWATPDHHGSQTLALWWQIDLNESIQPRTGDLADILSTRCVFIVDSRDFMLATEHVIETKVAEGDGDTDAIDHLVEVANRSPEICIVFDYYGRMSAWGLENVGCKSPKSANVFNIAHVDGLELNLAGDAENDSNYVQAYSYCDKAGGHLSVLIHHFDGQIDVYECNVAHLFDPAPRSDRLVSQAVWAGHSTSIKKIVRNYGGQAVVSRTDENQSVVWKHTNLRGLTTVSRQCVVPEREHIHRICVIRRGDFVIFLHHGRISLWSALGIHGELLATCHYSVRGTPLCLLVLPELRREGPIAHVASITTEMEGIVWEVHLPRRCTTDLQVGQSSELSIREFCKFNLGASESVAYVLPVDPVGSPPVISGFLDTFARDIAISYTSTGMLRSWTARVNTAARKVEWLETCSVDTGVSDPALASGSSIRKAALVNTSRSELTIWDVRGAQLELRQDYESTDPIQDLDWTSTPDDQSILAVGFPYRVVLLAQMRYDYLNKGPAWTSIRQINISDMTSHPIGDSTWLRGGNLIIGAGNQLFMYDNIVDLSDAVVTGLRLPHRKKAWDIFEVVSRLNGPLPLYHPQFLGQCTLAGKSTMVHRVLLSLQRTLKYHVDGETIDNNLGLDLQDFYAPPAALTASRQTQSSFVDSTGDSDAETVTESTAVAINEKLAKFALTQLSSQEQIHLADIVECVAVVEKQRRSMDDNAARFMLFFRQHVLRRGRANEVNLSWREINWAFHSGSQDILVDIVSNQFHGKPLWEHARESGMFMWITDIAALRAQFEFIARNEYTKSDLKNPIDCSLFYLALKKKTVLQGLWRMAAWNPEQAATVRLLSNNFHEKKWTLVAMKNAYVLLGKHRYEYAAAFFLLADRLKDAVNVILNQLKDLQLAIAVTRVYEGERGPILRELLEAKVLPLAAQDGNRWLASWAFWMLHRRDMAVRALISPVYTLLESPQSPGLQAKLFLTDDPALIILYSQLRHKTLQTLRGVSKITPKVEWEFVLHSARLYDRMGCDLLALDLGMTPLGDFAELSPIDFLLIPKVRNWEFLLPTPPAHQSLGNGPDPRKMLRRRSSLVVADLPPVELKSGGVQHPPPSVFEEPESSSLLDSFGF